MWFVELVSGFLERRVGMGLTGVGSFVPVTLEQLARENGVLWVDKVTRCVDVKEGAGMMGEKAATCVVKLFGYWVNTASYAMWVPWIRKCGGEILTGIAGIPFRYQSSSKA